MDSQILQRGVVVYAHFNRNIDANVVFFLQDAVWALFNILLKKYDVLATTTK